VGPDTTTFTASVNNKKTYEYRVAAYNNAGLSAWSNAAKP
jgi:hypothetical protein